MKPAFLFITMAALWLPSGLVLAQRVATTASATELISPGAFDAGTADDIAVVDRATGILRIGLWNAGTFTWTTTSAGLNGVEHLCVGNMENAGGPMSIATGSALAQRLEVFTPSTGNHYVLADIGLLPTACVLTSSGSLLVSSGELTTSTTSLKRLENLGPVAAPAWMGTAPSEPLISGHAVSQGAAFLQADGTTLEAWTLNGPAGAPERSATLSGLAPDTRYVAGRFGSSGQDSYALWVPGASVFQHASVGGAGGFNPPEEWSAGLPIGRLQVISSPIFTSDDWLLAISQDGDSARLFSFTPGSAPVPQRSFTAPSGTHFTGAAPQGSGHFVLLHGTAGHTSGVQRVFYNGTSHTVSAVSPLPALKRSRVSPTVFLHNREPWVDPAATLVSLRRAGDWSNTAVPGNASILTDAGVPTGLANPSNFLLSGIGGLFAMPNQIAPAISIASLGAASATLPIVTRITPPPAVPLAP